MGNGFLLGARERVWDAFFSRVGDKRGGILCLIIYVVLDCFFSSLDLKLSLGYRWNGIIQRTGAVLIFSDLCISLFFSDFL